MRYNPVADLGPVRTEKMKPATRIFRATGLLMIAAAGCASDPSTPAQPRPATAWNTEGREVFKVNPPRVAGGAEDPSVERTKSEHDLGLTSTRGGWAVLLGAFSGATAGADAARTRALADRAGLADAYAERRGDGVAVLWGEFASPGSPESKAALERARRSTVGGEQPFSASMLVPPPKQVEGELSPWDLRTVRREFEARNEGRRLTPSLSTLLIGFYGPTDSREPSAKERADARAAAEDAVKNLRAEGEEAYFFHGPRGSSVTIGLFENDRVDPSVAADLRKKFPHKLVNGAGLKVSVRTSATQKVERLDPSQLVEVPR